MKYKLRAECQHDIGEMLQAIRVTNLTVTPILLDGGIVIPDVEVIFQTDLDIHAIRKALTNIIDGHVMAETVQPIHEYTGDRIRLEQKK